MEVGYRNDTTPPGTFVCHVRRSDPGTSRQENMNANNRRVNRAGRVRAVDIPGSSRIERSFEPRRLRRFASLNVGTMTGKSFEIEDMMNRRRLDILCVQETKWKNTSQRARFLNTKTRAHKMFYNGTEQGRNGIGIILKASLAKDVLKVCKPSDRLMAVKVVMDGEVWNIISGYAPQIGCEQSEKDAFWYDLHTLLKNIPNDEQTFFGGDLNGHVGEANHGYEDCHGGFGFGTRNAPGEEILALCKSLGLQILNTMFIKSTRHRITYSSGGNETQIDYHLVPSHLRRRVKDCKVILGESVATQHRLLVSEFFIGRKLKPKQRLEPPKIKWYNLDKDSGDLFSVTMKEYLRDIIVLDEDQEEGALSAQDMWNLFHEPCLERARTLLGVSKGRHHIKKETWWWNRETKEAVSAKTKAFQAYSVCSAEDEDEKQRLWTEYDNLKKVSKKLCAQARAKMFEQMYNELEDISPTNADREQTLNEIGQKSKYAGTKIFKIASQHRRNAQEITFPKFITDEQGNLLVEDEKILNRWREYSEKLLNEEFPRQCFPTAEPVHNEVSDFSEDEIYQAIKGW